MGLLSLAFGLASFNADNQREDPCQDSILTTPLPLFVSIKKKALRSLAFGLGTFIADKPREVCQDLLLTNREKRFVRIYC
jgi:hypothetical protein